MIARLIAICVAAAPWCVGVGHAEYYPDDTVVRESCNAAMRGADGVVQLGGYEFETGMVYDAYWGGATPEGWERLETAANRAPPATCDIGPVVLQSRLTNYSGGLGGTCHEFESAKYRLDIVRPDGSRQSYFVPIYQATCRADQVTDYRISVMAASRAAYRIEICTRPQWNRLLEYLGVKKPHGEDGARLPPAPPSQFYCSEMLLIAGGQGADASAPASDE